VCCRRQAKVYQFRLWCCWLCCLFHLLGYIVQGISRANIMGYGSTASHGCVCCARAARKAPRLLIQQAHDSLHYVRFLLFCDPQTPPKPTSPSTTVSNGNTKPSYITINNGKIKRNATTNRSRLTKKTP
jgi:hypothetical protein